MRSLTHSTTDRGNATDFLHPSRSFNNTSTTYDSTSQLSQFKLEPRPHFACNATPTLSRGTRIVPTRGSRCLRQPRDSLHASRYCLRKIERRAQEQTPHAVLRQTAFVPI